MPAILLATTHFEARVIKETSAGIVADYGRLQNEARLYQRDSTHYAVEWDAGDNEGVTIGIWTDTNKKVVDYDGVFSLPKEIKAFLKEQGFDTSEVL